MLYQKLYNKLKTVKLDMPDIFMPYTLIDEDYKIFCICIFLTSEHVNSAYMINQGKVNSSIINGNDIVNYLHKDGGNLHQLEFKLHELRNEYREVRMRKTSNRCPVLNPKSYHPEYKTSLEWYDIMLEIIDELHTDYTINKVLEPIELNNLMSVIDDILEVFNCSCVLYHFNRDGHCFPLSLHRSIVPIYDQTYTIKPTDYHKINRNIYKEFYLQIEHLYVPDIGRLHTQGLIEIGDKIKYDNESKNFIPVEKSQPYHIKMEDILMDSSLNFPMMDDYVLNGISLHNDKCVRIDYQEHSGGKLGIGIHHVIFNIVDDEIEYFSNDRHDENDDLINCLYAISEMICIGISPFISDNYRFTTQEILNNFNMNIDFILMVMKNNNDAKKWIKSNYKIKKKGIYNAVVFDKKVTIFADKINDENTYICQYYGNSIAVNFNKNEITYLELMTDLSSIPYHYSLEETIKNDNIFNKFINEMNIHI